MARLLNGAGEKKAEPSHQSIQKKASANQSGDMVSAINDSPLMVSQRRTINSLFGSAAVQCQEDEEATAQRQESSKSNNTGLPDNLKSGIENLSGVSMDSVKVHYNSAKPAQLNAHAYAQGTDIHVAAGQEKHLPHEAWHVVQQAQGRVKPTVQMKEKVPVNDDPGLEKEADVMGAKALSGNMQMKQKSSGKVAMPTGNVTVHQAKTLAQAGGAGGLAESGGEKDIIGGNLGPTKGKAYVKDIGGKATKDEALAAAAQSYGTLANARPVNGLLSIDLIKDRLVALQGTITAYLNTANEAGTADAAQQHVRDTIIKPVVVAHLHANVSDGDLDSILGNLRKVPVTKKPNHTFKADLQGENKIKNTFAKPIISSGWHANADVIPVEPFLYGVKSRIADSEDLHLYYQHSPDWPGYVTYIEDDAASSKMRLGGALANPDTQGVPDTYSNFHEDTGDTSLSGMTGIDATRTRKQNEGSFDAMTKLAGEGARFVCVRDNVSKMTNNSRFYVVGADSTKYVKFSDLWSSWASTFGKANNISNDTVKSAINNNSDWTYDGAGGKSARVLGADDPVMGANDVNLT